MDGLNEFLKNIVLRRSMGRLAQPNRVTAFLVSTLFIGCTDPVTPDFEFREGLVFIGGFASTSPGASFVTINESAVEFGVYVVNAVDDASVSFENMGTGEIVPLFQQDEAYFPAFDFRAKSGERWKLNIQLANGKRYESTSEQLLRPVPITDLRSVYSPELEFREIYGGKFVPGQELLISFDDPANEDNYHYWSYRSYENLDFCEKCYAGYFREGECIDFPASISGIPYYDYSCESECWRIRFPESMAIFDDQFTNGKKVTDLSIGNSLLYTREDIVVEVQQFSLTPAAYDYYKILKDLIDNNSCLNAQPPAALIGNRFNPDNMEDFVFKRFTAAATSTAAIFIDRTNIKEKALEKRDVLRFESSIDPVPPPQRISAPCAENRYRTPIKPPGWIDQ